MYGLFIDDHIGLGGDHLGHCIEEKLGMLQRKRRRRRRMKSSKTNKKDYEIY
jgi:hypothetical protein